jgi:hypothetical protein
MNYTKSEEEHAEKIIRSIADAGVKYQKYKLVLWWLEDPSVTFVSIMPRNSN